MTPTAARPPTAWWLTVVLALVAGAAVAATWVTPAQASDDCDGVWVVVDASELGGSQSVRCAEGNPASGLAALTAAGHDYSFVPRIPGMVCTIDARPDPCNGAPADAYWSYWHAEEGGSWTYASRGAGERNPQPGSVDGWAFGSGGAPGISPPAPGSGSGDSGDSTDTADGTDDDGGTSGSDASDASAGDAGSQGSDGAGESSGRDDGSDDPTSSEAQSDRAANGDDEQRAADAADQSTSGVDRDTEVTRFSRPDDGAASVDDDADPSGAPTSSADDKVTVDEDTAHEATDDEGAQDADEVALAMPSGGGWAGMTVGATVVAALAGGALLQGRRRRLEA